MTRKEEVLALLDRLQAVPAADLEDQRLDFKEWDERSHKDATAKILEAVVCMANGGGGTVVVGVNDKKVGRRNSIVGVPADLDVNRLKRAVYDGTDPRLTPTIEEIAVPEGTGRLVVLQVHAGTPPYTDTRGNAKIRVGKDCQPLTGYPCTGRPWQVPAIPTSRPLRCRGWWAIWCPPPAWSSCGSAPRASKRRPSSCASRTPTCWAASA
jgi:hypothetical protein